MTHKHKIIMWNVQEITIKQFLNTIYIKIFKCKINRSVEYNFTGIVDMDWKLE